MVATDLKVTVIPVILVALDNVKTTVPVNTDDAFSEGGPLRIKGLIGSKDIFSCDSRPKCILK